MICDLLNLWTNVQKESIVSTCRAVLWFLHFGPVLRDTRLYQVRWEHVPKQVHQRVDSRNILRSFFRLDLRIVPYARLYGDY